MRPATHLRKCICLYTPKSARKQVEGRCKGKEQLEDSHPRMADIETFLK